MKRQIAAFVVTLLAATAGVSQAPQGGIVITPANPTTTDRVTISLENRFGVNAEVDTDSIWRSGNTFTITQRVKGSCQFSNPPVISVFDVGQLPVGTYNVVANISFTPLPVSCTPPTVTQNSSFIVSDPAAIPALDWRALIALAGALGLVGAFVVKR